MSDLDADAIRTAWALQRLRHAGWSVAVHNDYTMEGIRMTFWLFTHTSGVWAKGEGTSDLYALMHVEAQAEAHLRKFGIQS